MGKVEQISLLSNVKILIFLKVTYFFWIDSGPIFYMWRVFFSFNKTQIIERHSLQNSKIKTLWLYATLMRKREKWKTRKIPIYRHVTSINLYCVALQQCIFDCECKLRALYLSKNHVFVFVRHVHTFKYGVIWEQW